MTPEQEKALMKQLKVNPNFYYYREYPKMVTCPYHADKKPPPPAATKRCENEKEEKAYLESFPDFSNMAAKDIESYLESKGGKIDMRQYKGDEGLEKLRALGQAAADPALK